MSVTNLGTVDRCMNPDTDCPIVPDPTTAHVLFYRGKKLVLCQKCGPKVEVKAAVERGEIRM